jgi:ribosomal protein S18 acetylase RimI-like enzyme
MVDPVHRLIIFTFANIRQWAIAECSFGRQDDRTMTQSFKWRQARLDDAAEIARLSTAHLGLYAEGVEVFDERIRLAPSGCYVLDGEADLIGYMFSHPWTRHRPPALHQMLGEIPRDADCWYIHDVAVDPAGRGGGQVRAVVNHVLQDAAEAGYRVAMLVAVNGADAYWQKLDFDDVTTDALRRKLRDYGDNAVYMERALSPR